MGKIISIFNQKGGVGKTTTAINLSVGIARKNKKVLLIDMDPQGNASSGLGFEKDGDKSSIYELISGNTDIDSAVKQTKYKNLDVITSNEHLAGLDIELAKLDSWQLLLKDIVSEVSDDYDFIFIDCPPSLGVLSILALTASQSVLVPIQCEYYALEGVSQLFNTIKLVVDNFNPRLTIEGVVLSMYDGRTNLSIQVVDEVKSFFKDKVYRSIIPRNVRLAEAPSYGCSIFEYDEKSKGAEAYNALAKEFIQRNK